MTTALSAEVRKNYVAGAWVEGAKTADDINPSDTNDVVGRFSGSFNGALVFVGANALVAVLSYPVIVGEIKRLELKKA